MGIIFAGIFFIGLLLTNAGVFYWVLGGKLAFKDCFRITTSAAALNRFFFTGSGYLAASYFFKGKDMPFARILTAFLIMEFFTIIFWIGLGLYFGADLALNLPWLFVPLAILLIWFFWNKRQKIKGFLAELSQGLRGAQKNIAAILLTAGAGYFLFFFYYYFLFVFFRFLPSWGKILRIISLSFSLGYLSPAPAGLGFKDAGLVFLLSNSGMNLSSSIWFAVIDRLLSMTILAVLAWFFCYKLIKEQVLFRFLSKKAKE